jgi:hypothetical protein
MSKEEYEIWLKVKHLPTDPPTGWIEFAWENWDGGYSYMYFPNEKVAKAYFSAHKINDYYLETT